MTIHNRLEWSTLVLVSQGDQYLRNKFEIDDSCYVYRPCRKNLLNMYKFVPHYVFTYSSNFMTFFKTIFVAVRNMACGECKQCFLEYSYQTDRMNSLILSYLDKTECRNLSGSHHSFTELNKASSHSNWKMVTVIRFSLFRFNKVPNNGMVPVITDKRRVKKIQLPGINIGISVEIPR